MTLILFQLCVVWPYEWQVEKAKISLVLSFNNAHTHWRYVIVRYYGFFSDMISRFIICFVVNSLFMLYFVIIEVIYVIVRYEFVIYVIFRY